VLPSVVFEFFRPDLAGKTQLHYRITLKNATVSSVDSSLDLTQLAGTAGAGRELETVELAFQSITVEDFDGMTSATDNGPIIAPPPVTLPQPAIGLEAAQPVIRQ
jgi:type VI protein secretion system component Hcp